MWYPHDVGGKWRSGSDTAPFLPRKPHYGTEHTGAACQWQWISLLLCQGPPSVFYSDCVYPSTIRIQSTCCCVSECKVCWGSPAVTVSFYSALGLDIWRWAWQDLLWCGIWQSVLLVLWHLACDIVTPFLRRTRWTVWKHSLSRTLCLGMWPAAHSLSLTPMNTSVMSVWTLDFMVRSKLVLIKFINIHNESILYSFVWL